jgi:hypothetical protein
VIVAFSQHEPRESAAQEPVPANARRAKKGA